MAILDFVLTYVFMFNNWCRFHLDSSLSDTIFAEMTNPTHYHKQLSLHDAVNNLYLMRQSRPTHNL